MMKFLHIFVNGWTNEWASEGMMDGQRLRMHLPVLWKLSLELLIQNAVVHSRITV